MRVGVQIVCLEDRPLLIHEQHSDQPFKPASNQKILTTAAAMALLPADFKFTTVLARRGNDLVVIGSGDPAIGDPKLARAARKAHHRPVSRLGR
jgi:serine-type D-Ala-D-Ala carboxypeptidase/endopeptidase (penicillin-binding protein 4)